MKLLHNSENKVPFYDNLIGNYPSRASSNVVLGRPEYIQLHRDISTADLAPPSSHNYRNIADISGQLC